MTQTYYWFVELSPASESVIGDARSYVKRSTSPPHGGYFYIKEEVDGYRHTITPKDGKGSIIRSDYGKLPDLETILNDINSQIVRKWQEEHIEILRKKRLDEIKKYKSASQVKDMEEAEEFEKVQNLTGGWGMMSGLYTGRKKSIKRKKVNINRKGPCKCMKTMRREKKK